MLQHVEAKHRVETILQARQIARNLRIDALHGDIRRSQEAVPQGMQVQGIFLGSDVECAARHQPAGQIADARADLKYFVTHVRPQFKCQPTQILRRPRQVVEHAAAVGRRIEIVNQPELRITAKALMPSFQPIFCPLHKCARGS